MDYLISLLDLIENKKKITGGNFIDLSLEEIANAWDKESVLSESFQTIAGTIKHVNKDFLNDVASILKKTGRRKTYQV